MKAGMTDNEFELMITTVVFLILVIMTFSEMKITRTIAKKTRIVAERNNIKAFSMFLKKKIVKIQMLLLFYFVLLIYFGSQFFLLSTQNNIENNLFHLSFIMISGAFLLLIVPAFAKQVQPKFNFSRRLYVYSKQYLFLEFENKKQSSEAKNLFYKYFSLVCSLGSRYLLYFGIIFFVFSSIIMRL